MKSSPYLKGFSKVAERCGLNPYSLIKFAAEVDLNVPDIIGGMFHGYNKLSPEIQKSINGALISGLVSFPFTGGDASEKLRKAILYGIIGGAGTYALDHYGLINKGMKYIHNRT